MAITTEMRAQVSQMYVAMFGRAPDGEGLGFWTQKMADGETIAQIADQMYATAPARSYYPDFLTNQEIIGRFYVNVLGRTADTEGLNYWTAKLNASGATAGSVIAEMVAVVASYTGTDAAGLESQKLFNNRAAVAQYYGEANLGVNDATTILSTVTSDEATVTAAKTVIDANAAGSAGAFTLTNGTDIATASVFTAGLVYTPGGDDRINALQDEDQLTGTSGTTDRLDATLGNANDNGANIITPKLADIETINVAFSGSGANAVVALDLQDATGQTEVNITRVSQSINFAEVGNLMSPASKLSLANTNANNAGTVEFSYGADVLKGATTGDLTVANVQVGTLNIGENISGIGAPGVALNGFENLTLTSFGAATNTIGTLNLPMDTNTDGKLTIKGTADLTLASKTNVLGAVSGYVEAEQFNGGVAQASGRLQVVDASELTGALKFNIGNFLVSAGKADTSGVAQNVTITGSKAGDTFYLNDTIGVGDVVNGGEGTDTMVVFTGGITNGTVSSVEQLDVTATANVTIDFDKVVDATLVSARNISNVAGVSADNNVVVTLNNLSVAQAAALTVKHGVTNNNTIDDLTLNANLKVATGAADTVQVTIAEGLNTDPRFNFTLNAANVENITLVDADSESNSVELGNFAQHTGTITLKGGLAGTFLNLDINTLGNDIAANLNGATVDVVTRVQQGLKGINTQDTLEATTVTDVTAGHYFDASTIATQVRLQAATIDASAELSDVIVRVSTNALSAFGAQNIVMGAGNDTVIFDNLNDNRSGLTISDTVIGGDGNDTLVIDGNGVRIALAASEWTNVKGFETLQLVGNNAAAITTFMGQNSYNLTLTNDFIDNNGTDMLAILNDNDASNDVVTTGVDTGGTATEFGVTIDARSLNAQNHFSYNGEEGVTRTADRFVVSDANTNGGNIIDGGAVDNLTTTFAGNADILEVRDEAVVTAGDLQNVKNVGTIAFNNGTSVLQTLNLQLNDTVVDAMVDSYHTATNAQVETLFVNMNDGAVTETAAVALVLDVNGLTQKSGVNVTLNNTAAGAGADILALSPNGGAVTVANFETALDGAGVVGAAKDKIQLSLSAFSTLVGGLEAGDLSDSSVAGGALSAADFAAVAGVTAATDVTATEIVFDTTNGAVYYNTNGTGIGGLVLIATLTGVADLAANDFIIVS